jgi:hypothetical protein
MATDWGAEIATDWGIKKETGVVTDYLTQSNKDQPICKNKTIFSQIMYFKMCGFAWPIKRFETKCLDVIKFCFIYSGSNYQYEFSNWCMRNIDRIFH